MAKQGDRFSAIRVSQGASKGTPQRIDFDNSNYISCVVQNTSLSGQTLWVGIDSEDASYPLQPGESLPLAARECAVLRGFLVLGWNDTSTQPDQRIGMIIFGKDQPQ